MLKKCNIVILFFICIVQMSCKDFLNKKQNFEYSDGSKLSDIQAILDDAEYMNRRTPSFPHAVTDDYYLPDKTFNGRSEKDRKLYMLELYEYSFPNDWANLYFQVFNANLCIENLEALKPEKAQMKNWKEVYGAALFFRAHANYWLVTTFGKGYSPETASNEQGIALRKTSDFNVHSFRSSLKESYDQIESDLHKAIRLLPKYVEMPLRPSQSASYGLMSRLKLAKREYSDAALYADSALSFNREILDFNNEKLNLSSSLPFSEKYFNEVVFYSAIGVHSFSTAHPSYARIDSTLYKMYHENDLRKQAYFLKQADGYRFKGMYVENANLYFTGITTGELLLTLAECKIRENKVATGLKLIDELLVKRFKENSYIPYSQMPQKEALSLVLVERRKELLMRGLRFIDIKRLNLETASITLMRKVNGQERILKPNDPWYALPIPLDVIQRGGITQNNY